MERKNTKAYEEYRHSVMMAEALRDRELRKANDRYLEEIKSIQWAYDLNIANAQERYDEAGMELLAAEIDRLLGA